MSKSTRSEKVKSPEYRTFIGKELRKRRISYGYTLRDVSEMTSLLGNLPRKESIIPLKHSYNKQKIYIHKKYIHEYSSLTKEELAILILKKEEELGLAKKGDEEKYFDTAH